MAKQYNNNLDIVRGLAAVCVVFTHLMSYPTEFDKQFGINAIVRYNIPGHIFFLVFFILSGYVIQLNTKQLGTKALIQEYLRKRIIRIVPIYVFSVLFAFFVTYGNNSWLKLLSNLFFVSVPAGNLMYEETPVWSLNYEVVYYLSYIVFSYFSISMSKTLKAILVIIAAYFLFLHNVVIHPLFLSYLIGFLFWVTGAYIADLKDLPYWKLSASRIMSVFLLIFCLQYYNPYGPILKILHIHTAELGKFCWYHQSVWFPDMFFYPLTILLMLALTHTYTRYGKYLVYFLFLASIFRLIMIYKVYNLHYILTEGFVLPTIFLIISMAFWFLDFELFPKIKSIIKSTDHLGHISYAMYLMHFPLLFLFGKFPATSASTFVVKLIIYLVTVYITAYLLEMKFQPWIKNLIWKKKKVVAPVN